MADQAELAPASTRRAIIAGPGLLASAISEQLAAIGGLDVAIRTGDPALAGDPTESGDIGGRAGSPDRGLILITASDCWDRREVDRIQAHCAVRRLPWLPVGTELGRAVIGPLYDPAETGCARCAGVRRRVADRYSAARDALLDKYPGLADEPSPWLTAAAARTVAALVADEITALGRWPGRTRRALLYVALDTLAVDAHPFLADPLCPGCGALPDDSEEAARIVLRPQPVPGSGPYRVRPLGDADGDRLLATYVDPETGLIQNVQRLASGGMAVAAAAMRTRYREHAEVGWGRTSRYRRSELVAVLEALERYAGMTPGGKRTVVRASFAEVRPAAIDPRDLGLYPGERYQVPGFPFEPFDPDRPRLWVWGYSFGRREPILVPQGYAYYSTQLTDPDDPLFAFEISNGCALGGCLEEAILYGLLELAERDAFLMTWYARLPAGRINLRSARDRSVPLLAHAIEAETGYQVLVYDTTMEHGIPSVWAMAICPPDQERPALACAAAAHLDAEQAAARALSELGPILSDLIERYPDFASRGAAMADDPDLVVTMDDHSILYSSPQARSRLDFLTAPGRPARSFDDIAVDHGLIGAYQDGDLTANLTEMVTRLQGHGLDVIVVDQTTAEQQAGGFHCVKTVVPGLLPMTFGHQNRRTYRLPRLLEVPKLLGYRDRALSPREINPYPHPFP